MFISAPWNERPAFLEVIDPEIDFHYSAQNVPYNDGYYFVGVNVPYHNQIDWVYILVNDELYLVELGQNPRVAADFIRLPELIAYKHQ